MEIDIDRRRFWGAADGVFECAAEEFVIGGDMQIGRGGERDAAVFGFGLDLAIFDDFGCECT